LLVGSCSRTRPFFHLVFALGRHRALLFWARGLLFWYKGRKFRDPRTDVWVRVRRHEPAGQIRKAGEAGGYGGGGLMVNRTINRTTQRRYKRRLGRWSSSLFLGFSTPYILFNFANFSMCTVVTTYLEHPCGATVFSGRAHVCTLNYLSNSILIPLADRLRPEHLCGQSTTLGTAPWSLYDGVSTVVSTGLLATLPGF
jgi:hypothetical protein